MNHLISPDKSELVPQLKISLCSCNNNLEIFVVVVVDVISSEICDNHLGLRLFVEVIKPKALGSCFQKTWQGQRNTKTKHKTGHKTNTKQEQKLSGQGRTPQDSPLDHHPPLEPAEAQRASGKSEKNTSEKKNLRKKTDLRRRIQIIWERGPKITTKNDR